MKKKAKSEGFLIYKGKPLVRLKNVIYYGNPKDRFIVKMNIKGNNIDSETNLSMSNGVDVQLIDNSKGIYEQKTVKSSSKSSLYPAIDLADIWLERYLSE